MKNVFEKVVYALSLFDRYKRGCAAFKCHFCGYSEMGVFALTARLLGHHERKNGSSIS